MPAHASHASGVAIALVLATAALAQNRNNAGFAAEYVRFSCDPQTGNNGHLGVCCDPADGHIFVSARALPATARPHVIYEFDARGALLGVLPQPAVHDGTSWGMRDLEWDGQSILGGSEAGITVIDRAGNLVNTIRTSNGPQPIVQPITMPVITVMRALALDQAGNGGNGSIFVADFGSSLFEIDLSGRVLNTWANSGWSAYGLAIDPTTGNLWVNSAPDAGQVAELDRATMALTGRRFPMTVPGVAGVSVQGGLSSASNVAMQHERWGTEWNLLHLVQGNPDMVAVNRIHLFPGKPGWREVHLRLGTSGSALSAGPVLIDGSSVLNLMVTDPMAAAIGQPCWTIIDFYGDAAIDGYTVLPGFGLLREHRTLNAVSTPATPLFGLLNMTVGFRYDIVLPPGFPLGSGDLFRVQALYLEPASSQVFASTNEGLFIGR